MEDLKNKVAVVTGGSSGIGLEISRKLAKKGMKVCILGVVEKEVNDVTKEFRSTFGEDNILGVIVDVSKYEEVEASFKKVNDMFGKIDCLVNCAGINGEQKVIDEYSNNIFEAVMKVDLFGTYYCMKEALKYMKEGSSIVNIASVLGTVGSATQCAYVAAKHGVVGLTKSAAYDLVDRKIRVNAVAPGGVLTPMVDGAASYLGGGDREKGLKMIIGRNPMKRLANPEEIANVTAFLLSEESGYVNAQTIVVDGGQTMSFL